MTSLLQIGKLITILGCCLGIFSLKAQTNSLLYHPDENAQKEIDFAVEQARVQKKEVLIMAGGNWCSWCLEFDRFTHADRQIDSLLKSDFVVYHLNYSRENKNSLVFQKYGFPQRFGFPVFLVLDEKGNRLHTQNSAYLEEGKSYSREKVLDFLSGWNRNALDPDQYKNDKK